MSSRLSLLVIDLQESPLFRKTYPGISASMKTIIPRVRRLIQQARRRGVPVIFTMNVMTPRTAPKFSLFRKRSNALARDKPRMIPLLNVSSKDYIIEKQRYNAFQNTELEILLANLGTETLMVTGAATEVCVESTVRGAIDRDFKVVLVQDCVTSENSTYKETSLQNMRNLGRGIEVKSFEAALQLF